MAPFVVGITAARAGDCKRGVAANVAARCAADGHTRVAVVDADPLTCDVGDRLGLAVAGQIEWPPLRVVPASAALDPRRAAERVARATRDHGLVIVDLPLGTGAPGPSLDSGLAALFDRIVVMTRPIDRMLDATARFVGLAETARRRGHLPAGLELVAALTVDDPLPNRPHYGPDYGPNHRPDYGPDYGPDCGPDCGPDRRLASVAALLGVPVVAAVPQLWGRTPPNLGFGPTLGFAALDASLRRLAAPSRLCGLPALCALQARGGANPRQASISSGHSRWAAQGAVVSVK